MTERMTELLIKILILGGGGLLVAWMKKKEGKVKIVSLLYIIGQALFICLTLLIQVILIQATVEIFQEGDTGRAWGFVLVSIFMFFGTVEKIKIMMKSILKLFGKEVIKIVDVTEDEKCPEDS